MLRACLLMVAVALPAFAAPPPACRAPLPSPAPKLEAVPFAILASAAVRAVDGKTLRAATHQKDGDARVRDCRGHEVVTGWPDSQPPGQLVEGGRQKLPDGRLALWIESGADPGAPATLLHGFLALVRLDGNAVVIDSIGAWENGEDAKHTLRAEKIGTGPIFVEPTGHSGTGGGTDSSGVAVWVEAKGRLVRTGTVDTAGFDEDMGSSGPHWNLKWKATLAFEDSLHATEKQTWTLVGGRRPEVAKTTLERYFVVDGDKLHEEPAAQERKPPHPANAPSKRVTIEVQAGPGTMKFTFETALISEEVVRQVADLAPEAGPEGISLIDSIEMCINGKPEYHDCGTRDLRAPHFFENAAVNIANGERVLKNLLARPVPPELELAKAWMVKSAAFRLEMEQRRLAYAKSGDLKEMKYPLVDVDPQVVCGPALAKLIAAPDAPSRARIAWYDWTNCLNDAFQNKRGEYPKQPWKDFLATYGIKAKYRAPDGD